MPSQARGNNGGTEFLGTFQFNREPVQRQMMDALTSLCRQEPVNPTCLYPLTISTTASTTYFTTNMTIPVETILNVAVSHPAPGAA
jgi:hypothetical protein